MKQLTDLQLVQQYQATRDEKYFLTLIDRYEGYIQNKTYYLYKKRRHWDNLESFEDIKQEIYVRALDTMDKVKIDKISDHKKFNYAVFLDWQIKNWEVIHKKNIYQLAITEIHINPDTLESLKRYNEINFILHSFEDSLKGKYKVVWNLFMQGKKKCEIAKLINISNAGVTGIIAKLKKEYKEFVKIK